MILEISTITISQSHIKQLFFVFLIIQSNVILLNQSPQNLMLRILFTCIS